ncbi:MAG: LysE family translocator [Burkholderiaceae bacterium]|nr:LysE family translocator [Burkholderiaceae bacterium]
MSLTMWWLFVGVTFFVSATPGPNMMLVMVSGARFGFRPAMVTMAGCWTALMAMMALSAAGLGATIQTFPALFDSLRLAGAAYLAYLGIKIWRAPVHAGGDLAAARARLPSSPRSLFRQGMLVGGSNPKAILFALAFLPQFIDPALPKLPQFAILLLTFSVIEIAWYTVYAGSGQRLAIYLRRASVLKLFNRVTGGVFVAFAVAMADVRR